MDNKEMLIEVPAGVEVFLDGGFRVGPFTMPEQKWHQSMSRVLIDTEFIQKKISELDRDLAVRKTDLQRYQQALAWLRTCEKEHRIYPTRD